jgi:hypothetical protein
MMDPATENPGDFLRAATKRAIEEFPRKKWEEILEIIHTKYASKCHHDCNIVFYNREQNYSDAYKSRALKRPPIINNKVYFKNFNQMMLGDLHGNNFIDIIKTYATDMIVEINVINLADYINHRCSRYLPGGEDEENKFVYEVYFNWNKK